MAPREGLRGAVDEEDSFYNKKGWYCIRTKPRCEEIASIHLSREEITVFNPRIEEIQHRSRRIASLFPGYIFANFSPCTSYHKITWTPGVKHILGSNNRPIPVEDEVIYLMMDRMEQGAYIRPQFNPGDKVRIKEGAFSELIGILEVYYPYKERIKVLLELFDRAVEVELPLASVERVRRTWS